MQESTFKSQYLNTLIGSTGFQEELERGFHELGCFRDKKTGESTLRQRFSDIDEKLVKIEPLIQNPQTAYLEREGLGIGIRLMEELQRRITVVLYEYLVTNHIHDSDSDIEANYEAAITGLSSAFRDPEMARAAVNNFSMVPKETLAEQGGILEPGLTEWRSRLGYPFDDRMKRTMLAGIMILRSNIAEEIKAWERGVQYAQRREGYVDKECPNIAEILPAVSEDGYTSL